MNLWAFFADAFMFATLLMLPSILWGSAVRRMVCAGAVTMCAAVAMLLFSFAYMRPDFGDLAIALALLSAGSTIGYAHAVERWL